MTIVITLRQGCLNIMTQNRVYLLKDLTESKFTSKLKPNDKFRRQARRIQNIGSLKFENVRSRETRPHK